MRGQLLLVVGPSGAGKDTLLDAARERLARDRRFVFARRLITRPADAGGEDHEAITEEAFQALIGKGGLLAWWRAHGLCYGLPASLRDPLAEGRTVVANVSRAALADIVKAYDRATIIEVTAPVEVLARRLAARGREPEEAIMERLARAVPGYPPEIPVITVRNDATLEEGIERFLQALEQAAGRDLSLKCVPVDTWRQSVCFLHEDCIAYPARDYLGPGKVDVLAGRANIRAHVNVVADTAVVGPAELGLSRHAFETLGVPEGTRVEIERTPTPESREALRSKIRGERLDRPRLETILKDIGEGRYTDAEIAAFLVSCARELDHDEVCALTEVRALHCHRFDWGRDIVVDKHSMGGVAGSRISLIVIPIVAAHGLTIPKTSSRAITSAAGTADAMEAVARVDLKPEEVMGVVEATNGCIAWNGRLNHSSVDDVMNAITRPLGIDSRKWAVASILSKKLAAGSSHVIVDIPVGPRTKVASREDGEDLAGLFLAVGRDVGLTVEAVVTDGHLPIGRGIGPALEVRDVLAVLGNDPSAPRELADKALAFAGRILEWAPDVEPGDGRARAEALLRSGAALASFDRIVDAQGRAPRPAHPGVIATGMIADRSGTVTDLDPYQLATIARRAGAPMDKGAGVDLRVARGDEVKAGDALYVVHANVESDSEQAMAAAARDSGVRIA